MKYVLVKLLVEGSPYHHGGIFNIQKSNPDETEKELIKAINNCLSNPDNDLMEDHVNDITFEPFPFTGTIDAEVELYVD